MTKSKRVSSCCWKFIQKFCNLNHNFIYFSTSPRDEDIITSHHCLNDKNINDSWQTVALISIPLYSVKIVAILWLPLFHSVTLIPPGFPLDTFLRVLSSQPSEFRHLNYWNQIRINVQIFPKLFVYLVPISILFQHFYHLQALPKVPTIWIWPFELLKPDQSLCTSEIILCSFRYVTPLFSHICPIILINTFPSHVLGLEPKLLVM